MRFVAILFTMLLCACVTNKTLSTITPTAPIPTPDAPDSTKYYQNKNYVDQIKAINADEAWDYLRNNSKVNDGTGSKILSIDTGILKTHTAFANKAINVILSPAVQGYTTYSTLGSSNPYPTTNSDQANVNTSEAASHGTRTAGVMVGNVTSDARPVSGVAFGASLDIIEVAQQKKTATTYDGNLAGLGNVKVSKYLSNLVQQNGYNVINMSFGGSDTDSTWKSILGPEVLKQNVLVVVSSGNNPYKLNAKTNASDPDTYSRAYTQDYTSPLMPANYAGTLNATNTIGMMLAVTGDSNPPAFGTNGRPSNEPDMNYCGVAKLFCLAAPNTNIVAPSSIDTSRTTTDYTNTNPSYYTTDAAGTSFSAPLVSGAAAVLHAAYPSLKMKEVGTFLLRGASPLYGDTETYVVTKRTQGQMGVSLNSETNSLLGQVSAIYGYGRLDVMGAINVIEAQKTAGGVTISRSMMVASPLISQALSGNSLTVPTYDDYDTYTMSLSNRIKAAPMVDISSQISGLIMQGKMQNVAGSGVANFGGFGYISSSNYMPNNKAQSGLSYTNGDVNSQMMYLGVDPSTSTNLTNSNIVIDKQFGGNLGEFAFAFQDNYRPNGQGIVKNLNNFEPYLVSAFSNASAKQVKFGANFGKFALGMQTVFGESSSVTNPLGEKMTPSTNIATTVSLNAGKTNDNLGFEGGILRESRTLLGSYSAGALSLGQNNSTIFAKIKATKSLFDGINFIGAFTIGRTTTQNPVGTSLFDGFSPIISRSFVAGLNAEMFGGKLEFTYSQPLAILSGSTVFNGVERQTISFKTTNFEQDFGLSFGRSSKNASISLQALYIQNRGNINNNNTFGGVLRVSKQW